MSIGNIRPEGTAPRVLKAMEEGPGTVDRPSNE